MTTLGSQVKTPSGKIGTVGCIDADDMIRVDFLDGSSEWCYPWNATELQAPQTQWHNPRYSRNNRL